MLLTRYLCVHPAFSDESQEDCSQDPPAAHRVDGDLPVRLQGWEDDAELEGADPPAGQWRRGQSLVICHSSYARNKKKACHTKWVQWQRLACWLDNVFSSGVITSSGGLFCRPHMQQSYGHRQIFADSSGGRWQQSRFWGWLGWEKSPIVHGLGGFFVASAALLPRQHMNCSIAAELNVTGLARR